MPEYPEITDMLRDVEYVRASSSLPLLSRIVEIGDKPYLDGGVSDPIPVQKAFELGCDKVIVVLTQHRGYRKTAEKILPLIRARYRSFPNLVQDMQKRHDVYNETLEQILQWENAGNVFVIAPENPLNIRRTEKCLEILRGGYLQGKELTDRLLPHLREFIKE